MEEHESRLVSRWDLVHPPMPMLLPEDMPADLCLSPHPATGAPASSACVKQLVRVLRCHMSSKTDALCQQPISDFKACREVRNSECLRRVAEFEQNLVAKLPREDVEGRLAGIQEKIELAELLEKKGIATNNELMREQGRADAAYGRARIQNIRIWARLVPQPSLPSTSQ